MIYKYLRLTKGIVRRIKESPKMCVELRSVMICQQIIQNSTNTKTYCVKCLRQLAPKK